MTTQPITDQEAFDNAAPLRTNEPFKITYLDPVEINCLWDAENLKLTVCTEEYYHYHKHIVMYLGTLVYADNPNEEVRFFRCPRMLHEIALGHLNSWFIKRRASSDLFPNYERLS